MENRICGVVVAAVTPFAEDTRKIDFDIFADYLEFLISKDVHGFFIAGTTGEGLLLSVEERAELFQAAAKAVKTESRSWLTLAMYPPTAPPYWPKGPAMRE